jgi:hypothetical protein
LDDDRVAGTTLLSSTRASSRRQPEDLAADHSVERLWCQLGHLLANDLHLGTIHLVGGQPLDLLGDGRACSTPGGGLSQGGADSLGIACSAASHDSQRCS